MVEYNVFLSWSGDVSKAIAEAWRDWLPLAIQGAKPWMSSSEIPKGTPWFGELADHLKEIRVGIICVTPDNLAAPSIHFEAGALSKTVSERAYVCPYLFNLKNSDLTFPLSQFQTTVHGHDDTKQLFHTLHRALQTSTLTVEQLDQVFEKWWPDLESRLGAIAPTTSGVQRPHRSERDILEEVLELVRDVASQPVGVQFGYQTTLAGIGGLSPFTLGASTPSRSTGPPEPLGVVSNSYYLGPQGHKEIAPPTSRSSGQQGPVEAPNSGRSTDPPPLHEERKEKKR